MAKHKQKISRNSSNPSPSVTCPAISVVIPLYNAEKYIGECLDSLLAQTFQNFEVIVVDDCSTDNSIAVVESYVDKFIGRLKLEKTLSNSGCAPIPRNKGLICSRGKYVFFMDNDDTLLPDAFEKLYSAAKNFDADVVDCEKYYRKSNDSSELRLTGVQHGNFVDKPTFETNNLAKRVEEFCNNRTWCVAWVKLLKRDLLIGNEITFPNLRISDDIIWTIEVLCCAQKILRIPDVAYIYHETPDSIMRRQRTFNDKINLDMNPIIKGLNFLDKFLDRFEFFKQNPQYRYALIHYLTNLQLVAFLGISARIPVYEVDKIFRQEFAEDMGEQTALISYLCSTMNIQRLQLIQAQQQRNQIMTQANQQAQQFNQFAAQAKQRIAELEAEVRRLKSKE